MNTSATGVYAIVNMISGGVYVGSTARGFETRWKEHIYELSNNKRKRTHFQHAWNKYGKDAFELMILEYVDNLNSLLEREQYWLDYHRMLVEVYNLATDVRNGTSEDSRRKLSETLMGHVISPETRQKISKTLMGRPGHKHTEESKQKMSKAMRGRKFSEEHRRNLSIARRKRKMSPLSEEHKRKIGKANSVKRGYKPSRGTRRKMSESGGKPYPAFINESTGETILAGINLTDMCKKQGLSASGMSLVKNGKARSYRGWILDV